MSVATSDLVQTPHFTSVVMRQAEPLHAYVSRRIPADLRGWLGVEDVLQEVWSCAFRAWAGVTLTGPLCVERWLMTITKRKLVDALRAARRLKRGGGRVTLRSTFSKASTHVDLFCRVTSAERTPSSTEAAAEAVAAIQVAFRTLVPNQRQAVLLTQIEGRSDAEAAELMDTSISALRGLVYRGLRKLRKEVGSAEDFFSDADIRTDASG